MIIRRMSTLPWARVDPIMQILREVIENGKREQQARVDKDNIKDIARAVGDTV